jgi:hypothetical protein
MSTSTIEASRETLSRAAQELRRATAAALAEGSFLSATLDDCRVDVDRALSLRPDQHNPIEMHALALRAELILRTWRRLQTGSYRAVAGEWPCSTCERGTLVDVARPGRMIHFRGVLVEVPAHIVIPTCNFCQAESLDPAAAAELDRALLSAYLLRQA